MNIFSNLLYYLLIQQSFDGSLFYLIQLLVVLLSTAVIYHKLNQPWWAAFVPVYSELVLFKIVKIKWYYIGFIIINYLVYLLPSEYSVLWMVSFLFQMGEFGVHLFAYMALSDKMNRGLVLPFVMLIFPYIAFPLMALSTPREKVVDPNHSKWNEYFNGLI